MKKIIYVGSFDPAHYGHRYTLQKAEKKYATANQELIENKPS